jgi:ABC-type multidrug transport system fused ATPase/permease subunit
MVLMLHVAVKAHLKHKRVYEMSAQSISFSQGVIMALGLLGALSLGGYQVVTSQVSVGNFTTLLVYWAQLAGSFPPTVVRSLVLIRD